MIKAIIFDNFGVLASDLWPDFMHSLPPETAQKVTQINHQYDEGLLSEKQFLTSVRDITGHTDDEIKAARNSNKQGKNLKLLDYIRHLDGKYKIGLMSNIATDWITREFLSQNEQSLFDDILMSYQVGITKPDLRIFRIACERLKVEPTEAIIIDDIPHYCEAAQSIGMQAIVYKNFQQCVDELDRLLNEK